jgi:YggT family protein
MIVQILAFLLETIFFLLIAAALLRAWMNGLRISMTMQPGQFIMALTDWLVKPLRRVLPKALAQSRIDWASIVAALLLALFYALIWVLLFGALAGRAGAALGGAPILLVSVLVFTGKMLIRVVLQTLFVLVLGFALLSWIQPGSPVYALLGRLTEPLLAPIRKIIPTIGGVDLSALVLLVLLQIGLMVLV